MDRDLKVYQPQSEATRKQASMQAWVQGFPYLVWDGCIYQVKDQGRKVQNLWLHYREKPEQSNVTLYS